jgi:UDPglucose--hexose-1-phosphate uridylyltransferase
MPNTSADAPGWSVRVVPNKFPALDRESTWQERSDSVQETRPGLGAHEVIIESPDHVVNFGDLGDDRLTDVLTAYRARLRAYRQDRGAIC